VVVAAAWMAAAVLLSGCGAGGQNDTTDTFAKLDRSAPARVDHAQRRDPHRRPRALSAPARRLQRQLKRALAGSGAEVGGLVEDVSSGQALFDRGDTVARPPASVEKLYTTVAALNLLGPDARFQTKVLGTGQLGPDGIWRGNLYLRGGGDPTFGDGGWNRAYEDGYGPTAAELAALLQHAGIRRVSGHIFADESLFDSDRGGPATADKPDTPDYGGELSALVYDHGMTARGMPPAVFAAHELALTMRGIGIRVGAAARTQPTPAGAVELAHVDSPPLSVLVRLMDVPSDDLIADMLDKQLGARLARSGTLAAGATEIAKAIANDYGLHPLVLDGSGLDRNDSTTPADVVSLLRRVWMTPTGNVLYAALPVVGEQGTVENMGVHTPAQGHCVAKTGTLDNVTNLAGYCHARSGTTLAFALMIDGPENYQSLAVLSRAVAAIARY
jgi:D-alanyl-D-alanine carboxypeptidase/D-alanyl-D-alanine-endopeptidase (penicillin-binding protein 4)